MRRRRIAALGLLLPWALLGAAEIERDRFDTVVIDAGHGGEDEGALGPGGLAEKELVLDVARLLAARLEAHGLRVVLTRSDDRFVPLEERTAIANDARGDLFVSIHANAARTRKARGIETYFLSLEASDEAARSVAARENEAFRREGPAREEGDDPLVSILGDLIATEHLHESNEFARLAQARLTGRNGRRSRGVKQAPFVVLMGLQMPASLVEIGFVTNPDEARALRRSDRRGEIARSLTRAVLEFGRRYDARRGKSVPAAAGGGREVRSDGRELEALRPVEIQLDFTENPLASVLIGLGRTRVLCTVSEELSVPRFLEGTGRGWVTAEYSLLPGSTDRRVEREVTRGRPAGRTQEIQRLIGRSLRAGVELGALGERTLWVDCDVLQADGGTRTAAICGGWVALELALHRLVERSALARLPVRSPVAAISVGLVDGKILLDLAYEEDARAEVDLNLVGTADGRLIEVQGTAEGEPFTSGELQQMTGLALRGIQELCGRQSDALAAVRPDA